MIRYVILLSVLSSLSSLPDLLPDDEVLELLEQTLAAHNLIRDRHGVPPLMINPELVDLAQTVTQRFAETGEITHVILEYRNQSVGQNFALSQGIRLKGWLLFSKFLDNQVLSKIILIVDFVVEAKYCNSN